MASSTRSSFIASDAGLSSSLARRSRPAVAVAAFPRRPLIPCSSPALLRRSHPAVGVAIAAAFPRRPLIPCSFPVLFRRSSSGVTSGAGERDLRAMAVVKKYKGTRMREKRLTEMIEQKVREAKEACEGGQGSDECKVAWDEVEELSKAKANLRRRLAETGRDPLESFCQENPDKDECGVVDDD